MGFSRFPSVPGRVNAEQADYSQVTQYDADHFKAIACVLFWRIVTIDGAPERGLAVQEVDLRDVRRTVIFEADRP